MAIQEKVRSQELAKQFRAVREFTAWIVEPLSPEDCIVQSMPDASPTRWHLAHTTWFFEAFVLSRAIRDYQWVDPSYNYLFNSYYNAVGKQFPRAKRGVLTRPSVSEVFAYRAAVDERLIGSLCENKIAEDLLDIVELGINHEQQHQELMLTDIKHALSQNPLFPTYRKHRNENGAAPKISWVSFEEGVFEIGHVGKEFAYDNEGPRHRVFLEPYELADRLSTNAEYAAFIEDGGYERSELWLSAGWATVQEQGWHSPIYWLKANGARKEFTLSGLRDLDPNTPVCHLTYFEADAFARWSGARFPTEFEWEHASQGLEVDGNLLDNKFLHPRAASGNSKLKQMFGDVWEWTSSSYAPYPGYKPAEGAIGEYNGKFMCNQYVLRGGSCATPQSHIRRTYRNFFPTDARWQFAGVRLARS